MTILDASRLSVTPYEPIIEREPPCMYGPLVEEAARLDPAFAPGAAEELSLDVSPGRLRELAAAVGAEVWLRRVYGYGMPVRLDEARTVFLGMDGMPVASASAADDLKGVTTALFLLSKESAELEAQRDALIRHAGVLGAGAESLTICGLNRAGVEEVMARPVEAASHQSRALRVLELAGIPTAAVAALHNSRWESARPGRASACPEGAATIHFWVDVTLEGFGLTKELRLGPQYHRSDADAAFYSREAAALARRASGVLQGAGFMVTPRPSTKAGHPEAALQPHFVLAPLG
ncbi:hypothetical protein ACIQF6_28105 [Kitasatospora sp. NPDC092948]|uniref:hypothetical protein n=1 Tax=Kitasatospora sp. NPDC092948 TaxID=3364088 RepID=UPI0037F507EF